MENDHLWDDEDNEGKSDGDRFYEYIRYLDSRRAKPKNKVKRIMKEIQSKDINHVIWEVKNEIWCINKESKIQILEYIYKEMMKLDPVDFAKHMVSIGGWFDPDNKRVKFPNIKVL